MPLSSSQISLDPACHAKMAAMNDYPEFMKNPANRIKTTDNSTPGVEGYIFDGADGSQMAFWTCGQAAISSPHAHEFDEYMVVVQGCYTLIIDGQHIPLNAGEEYFISKGIAHGGKFWPEHAPYTPSNAPVQIALEPELRRRAIARIRRSVSSQAWVEPSV